MLQLPILGLTELQGLPVLPIGGPEAVFMVVGLSVHRPGVEGTIIPLLELHRLGAGLLGRPEELFGGFQIALVIMAHLGDDITVSLRVDQSAVNNQFRHLSGTSSMAVVSRHPMGRLFGTCCKP